MRDFLGLVLVLGAFASAPIAAATTASEAGIARAFPEGCTPPLDPATIDTADVRYGTGFIGILRCWPARVDDGSFHYLNDLYSHWVIEQVHATDAPFPRDYAKESSPALVRLFFGESRSFIVTVKIRLKEPDSDFTVPIATVNYEGKVGHGESFLSQFKLADMGLDFFRITPNTSAMITVTASSTREADVKVAGKVLSTLGDALNVVAPHGALLTALNREQNQKIASAYDNALSSLLSNSQQEDVSIGRIADEWKPGAAIYFSIDLPRPKRWDGRAASPNVHRTWFSISMSCPRLSIFDSKVICPLPQQTAGEERNAGLGSRSVQDALRTLHQRVTAEQVLNYKLGANRTIREQIIAQPWFVTFLKNSTGRDETIQRNDAKIPVRPVPTAIDPTQPAAAGLMAAPPVIAVPPANTEVGIVGPTTAAADASKAIPNENDRADLRDLNAQRGELCALVTTELYQQGLSSLDARIGLWAVITGISDFAAIRGKFNNIESCAERIPLPNGSWQYSKVEAPKS